jgi:membrane-bound serine protease (ClpP class)
VMLLIAAFTLLVLEAKFPSHGVLAATGILALVFGTLTLVEGPIPEMRVHISTAIACGLAFGLITVFLVRIAIRARRNKVITGPQALIGNIAIAQQPLTPRGQVLVHGELWQAESSRPAAPGDQLRVRSVDGLTLLVDRIPEEAHTAD